jgi:hypothetical protein
LPTDDRVIGSAVVRWTDASMQTLHITQRQITKETHEHGRYEANKHEKIDTIEDKVETKVTTSSILDGCHDDGMEREKMPINGCGDHDQSYYSELTE